MTLKIIIQNNPNVYKACFTRPSSQLLFYRTNFNNSLNPLQSDGHSVCGSNLDDVTSYVTFQLQSFNSLPPPLVMARNCFSHWVCLILRFKIVSSVLWAQIIYFLLQLEQLNYRHYFVVWNELPIFHKNHFIMVWAFEH